MIRKLLAFSFLAVLTVFSAKAQQDPLYALYLNNPLTINPAYTGLNNNFNAMVGFRKQWTGFAGAPSTTTFTAHTSLVDNKMGIGMIVFNDQIGNLTTTQATASYAYKVKLTEEQILSFGLQAGIINFKSSDKDLTLHDPGDPVFGSNLSQIKPTFGAGAILKTERYLIGLSVPRILNATLTSNGNIPYTAYQQHYYLFGSYIFQVTERIQLKPSVLLKDTKNSPISADVNFNVNFDRLYTVGVYTRNLNQYGALLQINFATYMKLAYAFELPTNSSVGTKYTTNEINLGIKMAIFSFHDRSKTSNWW